MNFRAMFLAVWVIDPCASLPPRDSIQYVASFGTAEIITSATTCSRIMNQVADSPVSPAREASAKALVISRPIIMTRNPAGIQHDSCM